MCTIEFKKWTIQEILGIFDQVRNSILTIRHAVLDEKYTINIFFNYMTRKLSYVYRTQIYTIFLYLFRYLRILICKFIIKNMDTHLRTTPYERYGK